MIRRKAYRLPDYLEHILEACRRIRRFTADVSSHDFFRHEMAQDAVIRNIEIVGEAVINIRRDFPDFLAANPVLPWGDICDMRNQLAHGYMTVDLKVVWNTAKRHIPVLEQQILELQWRIGPEAAASPSDPDNTPTP